MGKNILGRTENSFLDESRFEGLIAMNAREQVRRAKQGTLSAMPLGVRRGWVVVEAAAAQGQEAARYP